MGCQWGCIIARWHYWSQMLVFNKSKTNLLEENDAFFIWVKYSHLAVCLHVIQPHLSQAILTLGHLCNVDFVCSNRLDTNSSANIQVGVALADAA